MSIREAQVSSIVAALDGDEALLAAIDELIDGLDRLLQEDEFDPKE